MAAAVERKEIAAICLRNGMGDERASMFQDTWRVLHKDLARWEELNFGGKLNFMQ